FKNSAPCLCQTVLFMLYLTKQDLPNNYLIPITYVPKEAGTCWVVLNIYPMEKSLEKLTNNFGDKSTNRESLLIFIEIFQTEILMQYFDCHYQEQHIPSGPYFDYMENLLRGADQGLFDFSCEPPPCPSTQQTFTTPQETSQSPHNLSTQQTPGTMLMQLMHRTWMLYFLFVPLLTKKKSFIWLGVAFAVIRGLSKKAKLSKFTAQSTLLLSPIVMSFW
uniref:Kit ligand n=1 Tax=Oreochromis aureus TaxID=47969 RepID=A0A668UVX0_OREAU